MHATKLGRVDEEIDRCEEAKAETRRGGSSHGGRTVSEQDFITIQDLWLINLVGIVG